MLIWDSVFSSLHSTVLDYHRRWACTTFLEYVGRFRWPFAVIPKEWDAPSVGPLSP